MYKFFVLILIINGCSSINYSRKLAGDTTGNPLDRKKRPLYNGAEWFERLVDKSIVSKLYSCSKEKDDRACKNLFWSLKDRHKISEKTKKSTRFLGQSFISIHKNRSEKIKYFIKEIESLDSKLYTNERANFVNMFKDLVGKLDYFVDLVEGGSKR